MIPEIEEKFKIINWLRGQRHIHNKKFQQLNQSQQGYLINRTYVIKDLIEILQQEINEIAKEHGNSYVDDNGNTVWVESKLKEE